MKNVSFIVIALLSCLSVIRCDLFPIEAVRTNRSSVDFKYETDLRHVVPEKRKLWITEIFSEVAHRFSIDANVTENCRNDYQLFKQHLQNQSIWAVRMLESSEWPTTSIFAGNYIFMGNWYECRLISAFDIEGQFCFANATYDFDVAQNQELVEWPDEESSSAWDAIKMYRQDPVRINRQQLKWGMCIPSSCTSDDLRVSLNDHLKPIFEENGISIDVDVDPLTCSKKEERKRYPKQFYYFWCISAVVLILMIICTWYDLINKTDKESSLRRKICTTFSVITHSKNLANSGPLVHYAAHATKAIVTCFALYAHLAYYLLTYPKYNSERIELSYKSMPFDLTHSALTDLFLLISGFLVFDYGIHERYKHGCLNLLMSVITRWIRMCLPFGVVIFFVIYVFPYIGDGPLWNYYVSKEAENCRENWWASVFGVANIFGVEKQCLVISWYISVDLHLTIIASILLYVIHRNPKFGAILVGIVFLFGMVITFVVVYMKRLNGVFMFYFSSLEDPRKSNDFNYQYIATYSRVTPYFCGFIAAACAHILKKRNYQFPMYLVRGVPFFGLIFSELYQLYAAKFYEYGRAYDVLENAIYAATHRWIFVAPVAFCLCVTSTSKIGRRKDAVMALRVTSSFIINSEEASDKIFEVFVRMKICRILGRLSLSTFLLNTVILLYYFSIQADLVPTSVKYNLHWMLAAQLLYSFLIGYLFHIIVEAPIFNIVKILLGIILGSSKKSTIESTIEPTTNANGLSSAATKECSEYQNEIVNERFVFENGKTQNISSQENPVVAVKYESYKF